MKISKEVRIGIFTASAIVIFFAGFYFLKGASVFSGEHEYYAYYDDVQGLQPAAPVQIRGYGVGRVSGIELKGNGKVKVTLSVRKSVEIPKGSIAKLSSIDLLGTKAITLQLSDSKEMTANKETLSSVVMGGIIDAISVEITPLIKDIRHAIGMLDSVMVTVNGVLDTVSRNNLHQSIANLDITMENFTQLSTRLNGESESIASVIHNANSITTNLALSNERITRIIDNAALTTDQLSKAPIEATFQDLQQTINQLKGVLDKINNNEGSLGLLVNDKALYNQLNTSLGTLNSLMEDIEKRPSRYINVTIFGRKNKKP